MAAVLVVEDVALVLMLAEAILREAGYRVMTAFNMAQAKAILDSDAQFDLLLADINLVHDTDGGLQIAQEAVAARPGVRVLYATAQTLTDSHKDMMVDGALLLNKPYTAPQLLAAVAKALAEDGNAAMPQGQAGSSRNSRFFSVPVSAKSP